MAWKQIVPMAVLVAMLAAACASQTESGAGGGEALNPYGSGSAPRQGGSAGSMSGGGMGSSSSMP